MIMTNKANLKNTSPHHSLFPGLNFAPAFLYFLIPSGTGGQEMVAAISSSHILCCSFLFSRRTPYTEATPADPLLPKPGPANPIYVYIDSLVRVAWC